MENELILGQRYTFYQKMGEHSKPNMFRANIKDIIFHNMIISNGYSKKTVACKTLRLHSCSDITQKSAVHCIPMYCIIQVDNMETILQNKSKLPVDVLRIIDNYL
jgi:hypothetical protein